MPELPDITVYVEALERHVVGARLTGLELRSPFLLRTATPDPRDAIGQRLVAVRRLGKRLCFEFERGQVWVLHLMIAGRLRFKPDAKVPKQKTVLAAFAFERGTLVLTEAGTRRQASLHVHANRDEAAEHDRGGLEVLDSDWREFAARLRAENHTLKRSLTSPAITSGIGNAYSDEILHHARLSPFALTSKLSDAEFERLHASAVTVLRRFTDELRAACGDGFPDKVTAFLESMAVHGKYRQPCPACGAPVQRIVYARNETNYCANCQTGGVVLKDRALSRLLKDTWPRSLDAQARNTGESR